MPCYSASNVRFISAKQQLQLQQREQFSMRERAKTATTYNNTFGTHQTTYPRFRESSRQNSFQLFRGNRNLERFKFQTKPHYKLKPKSQQATTLSRKELERLKTASRVITVEERLDALARQEKLTKELDEQAERIRKHFHIIDEERTAKAEAAAAAAAAIATPKPKEDFLDLVDKEKLLERAFIAKHEQEEEVKAVNRIILNAKCHAVRDAQVQEKHDIEKDYRMEEKRLERMVIEGAAKALAAEDFTAIEQKRRNAKYAKEIRQQLEQRESLRYIEAQRIEEEARIQREAFTVLKRAEERQLREAWERRQQFCAELNRVVEMSNLFKKMLSEQEREAEMRIAAYMREKQEREKQLKREKQLAKEEFERQQQRLYVLAQKQSDAKTQRDEIMYSREQERIEREYRQRELEAALRKKQLEQEIKLAREHQLEETKSRQALQIASEEKDFNVLIENLKKEEIRLKKEAEKREEQRKLYRTEIMQQMSDKATNRRRLLEEERKETKLWHDAEKQRMDNIRAVIAAKLAAMRAASLPERYIKDVEKQLERIIKTNPINRKLKQ